MQTIFARVNRIALPAHAFSKYSNFNAVVKHLSPYALPAACARLYCQLPETFGRPGTAAVWASMAEEGIQLDLKLVLERLQAADFEETLAPNRWLSVNSFPAGGPGFLRPAVIKFNRRWCGLAAGLDGVLTATAERISANPVLAHLAWHYYCMIFEYDRQSVPFRLAPLEEVLGDDGPLL